MDFRRRPEPDTSPLGLALYRRAAAWIGFTFDAQSMETNPVKTRLGARELFHGADMPARFLQNPITFRIQKVIGVLVCLQLTPAEEEELCLWAGGNARHVWSLSTEDCPWHPGVTRPYLVTPTFHAPGGALSVQWIDPPMAEWRIEHFDHVPADPDGLGL